MSAMLIIRGFITRQQKGRAGRCHEASWCAFAGIHISNPPSCRTSTMHPVNNQTTSCALPLSPFLGEWMCVLILLQFQSGGWAGRPFPTRGSHFSGLPGAHFSTRILQSLSVKYRPAKQNTDPIGYYFDNFGWISSAGLHSRCVESWQTNYGLDFLFHISQLWFQNLLALVTRYQEFTVCLRFAVCMHSWIVEIWVCQT